MRTLWSFMKWFWNQRFNSDYTIILGWDRQVSQSIRSGFGWQQEAFPVQVFLCHEPEAEGSVVHHISAVSNRFQIFFTRCAGVCESWTSVVCQNSAWFIRRRYGHISGQRSGDRTNQCVCFRHWQKRQENHLCTPTNWSKLLLQLCMPSFTAFWKDCFKLFS